MYKFTEADDGGSYRRLRAHGSLSHMAAPSHEEPLAGQFGEEIYGRPVLLDMEDVEFIDSSGVSWLLKCHHRFEEHGGRLMLHSLPQLVHNTLKVLRMQLVLHIADSRRQAERELDHWRPQE